MSNNDIWHATESNGNIFLEYITDKYEIKIPIPDDLSKLKKMLREILIGKKDNRIIISVMNYEDECQRAPLSLEYNGVDFEIISTSSNGHRIHIREKYGNIMSALMALIVLKDVE